jgi:hypothetical protein
VKLQDPTGCGSSREISDGEETDLPTSKRAIEEMREGCRLEVDSWGTGIDRIRRRCWEEEVEGEMGYRG